MTVERLDYLYIETRNYAEALRFWQGLGFALALDLGGAGRLEPPGGGPGIFVEEVHDDRPLTFQAYLRVGRDTSPGGFVPSHWGTELTEVTDPDGRTWMLQRYPAT